MGVIRLLIRQYELKKYLFKTTISLAKPDCRHTVDTVQILNCSSTKKITWPIILCTKRCLLHPFSWVWGVSFNFDLFMRSPAILRYWKGHLVYHRSPSSSGHCSHAVPLHRRQRRLREIIPEVSFSEMKKK